MSGIARAGESPLTLLEAQRLATVRSKQIEGSDLAISASREMSIPAAERPDPVAKFGVENLPVNGAERFSVQQDFMTMRTVGLTQEITRPSKLHARAGRADQAVRLAEAQRVQTLASVQRNTALAWLDRYYAEVMEKTVLQQVQLAQLEVNATEAEYRGGRGTASEVLAMRGSLAQLEDLAADASREVRSSKIALTRWVGDAAGWPLAGRPAIDAVPLHTHTLDSQLAEHPEILALERREALARAEVEVARANRHADWSVNLEYSQRGSGYTNMVTLEFSVPLEIDRAHRQNPELAAKLAEASQARTDRDDMLREHVAEVGAMLEEWNSARERRDRYRASIIPLAADRTSVARAAYRGGKATLSEVLLAQRDEIDARLKALQIEAGAARLWAQLTFLSPVPALADVAGPTVSASIDQGELP
jgi:outer membrane protein TolC